MRSALTGVLCVGVFLLGSPALAQDRLEDEAIGPRASQLVAASELKREVGRRNVRILWDPATGCPRLVTFKTPLALTEDSPRDATTELLTKLAPLYGSKYTPQLTVVNVRRAGPRRVVVLEQRVGAVLLEGAQLQIVLTRKKKQTYALKVIGRVYRDPPLAFDTIAVPKGKPLAMGKVQLIDTEPRLIGTRRGGEWQPGIQTAEVVGGMPTRVLKDASGRVLAKTPLACAGTVSGTVYPTDPRAGTSTQPLRDLLVRTRRGHSLTNARGRFGGSYGSLPGGLEGRFERVIHNGDAYPRTSEGRLSLSYSGRDARLDEVNVYYHLVETRRWLGQYAHVPGVSAALQRKTVAMVGTTDFNALAAPTGCLVGNQRYDTALFFGNVVNMTSRDASVITHERIHSLQHGMGVGMGAEIQEALADYFACARLDSPEIGIYSFSVGSRDISQFRHWPEDEVDDSHETGIILAGALWDARKELGDAVGGHVLAALPSDKMTDLAQAVVDGAPEAPGKVLEKHFVRHGLLSEGTVDKPPLISIASAVVTDGKAGDSDDLGSDLVVIQAKDLKDTPRELTVTATDPEGRKVTLSLTGFERSPTVKQSVTQGAPATATLRFEAPMPPGGYPLTITAQDEAGNSGVRILQVFVYEKVEKPTVEEEALVKATVGERKSVSLLDLAQPEEGPDREYVKQKATYRLSGPRVGGATIADGKLILEPRPGEEGVHRMSLQVKHMSVLREQTVALTIVVGSGTPWIEVQHASPTVPYYDYKHRNDALTPDTSKVTLPPGRPLTVEAEKATELDLIGYANLPGEEDSYETVTLSLEGQPEGVDLLLVPGRPEEISSGGLPATMRIERDITARMDADPEPPPPTRKKYPAKLFVTPTDPKVRSVEVTLVATAGERVAKRTLTLLVVPEGPGKPPVIEGPAQVKLHPDVNAAIIQVTVSDPDGKEIQADNVVVLSPSGTDPSAAVISKFSDPTSGKTITRNFRVTGKEAFTVVIRATDNDGEVAVKEVSVVTDESAGTEETPDPRGGAIEGLNRK